MNTRHEDERKTGMYIEEYLYKKECDKKWIQYWVALHGTCMLFYSHHYKESEKRDAFKGFIELTPETRCVIARRKKYSFPFFLVTKKSKYYLKCTTPLQRHQWMFAIDAAVQGKEPFLLPHHLGVQKDNAIAVEEFNNLGYTSDLTTDESSQETNDTNFKPNEASEMDSLISEPSNSKIIFVASQPSEHKITNFLSNESPDMSETSVSGVRSSDYSRQDGSKVSPRCSTMKPSGENVGTVEKQSSQSQLKDPTDISKSDSIEHLPEGDNQPAVAPHQTTANYNQCARLVLTTSTAGITTVDLTKDTLQPKQSAMGPAVSRLSTQNTHRMVRSADWQKGRSYLSNSRPNSQGSYSGRQTMMPFGSQISLGGRAPTHSRFSRHLVSSAPDINLLH